MALCAAGLRDLSREDVLAVGQYHAPPDGDLSISRMISRVTAKPSWSTFLLRPLICCSANMIAVDPSRSDKIKTAPEFARLTERLVQEEPH